MAENAGGYVGLFLGWALAHLPDSVAKVWLFVTALAKKKTPGSEHTDNA